MNKKIFYLIIIASMILGLVTILFCSVAIIPVVIMVSCFNLALFLLTKTEAGKILNYFRTQSKYLSLFLIIFSTIVINGCVLGVTKVDIYHDQLATIKNKKEGNILVREFIDRRKETQYIGNKRNLLGMPIVHIGTQEGVKIEKLLTEYFAEALRTAGYNTVIQGSQSTTIPEEIKFDAIVEGEILEFWLDLLMATWHKVTVLVKTPDKDSQKILWEKEIHDKEVNFPLSGTKPAFEKVIREALTKALNQAANGFASDEFYNSIMK